MTDEQMIEWLGERAASCRNMARRMFGTASPRSQASLSDEADKLESSAARLRELAADNTRLTNALKDFYDGQCHCHEAYTKPCVQCAAGIALGKKDDPQAAREGEGST